MPQNELSITRPGAWQEAPQFCRPPSGVTRRLIIVLTLASAFAAAVDSPHVKRSSARPHFSCNPFLTNDPCAPISSGYGNLRTTPD